MAKLESPYNQAMSVFKRFDSNSDGTIDRGQLVEVLSGLDCEKLSEDQVRQLIEAAEKRGSGRVRLDKFLGFVFGDEEPRVGYGLEHGGASLEDEAAAAEESDQEESLEVMLRSRPFGFDVGPAPAPRGQCSSGVAVSRVEPDSAAARAGLE